MVFLQFFNDFSAGINGPIASALIQYAKAIVFFWKDKGFDVRIFDTAFYKEKEVDRYSAQEDERAETMTKPIQDKEDIWQDRPNDMLTDLKILMNEFKPSLVGVSILENTSRIEVPIS